MTWRYQPVWTEDDNGYRHYSMASVDVDAAGALVNWVQDDAVRVYADTPQALSGHFARMLMDANLWKPVAFASLKAGMVFERVEG